MLNWRRLCCESSLKTSTCKVSHLFVEYSNSKLNNNEQLSEKVTTQQWMKLNISQKVSRNTTVSRFFLHFKQVLCLATKKNRRYLCSYWIVDISGSKFYLILRAAANISSEILISYMISIITWNHKTKWYKSPIVALLEQCGSLGYRLLTPDNVLDCYEKYWSRDINNYNTYWIDLSFSSSQYSLI